MGRKKKKLIDSLKNIVSPKEPVEEKVVEKAPIDETPIEETPVEELTTDDFLSNGDTLEELSNGKGEDDELAEPLADE